MGFPAVLIMLAVLWPVITFLYRGTGRSITLEEARRDSAYPPKSMLVIAVSVITAAGWITGPLHGYSLGTVALVPVLFFFGGRLLPAADLGAAACLMSTLMSNTATANLIMPIVIGMNLDSCSPVLVGVAFSCTLAMALPISTPPNAPAFSTEGIGVRDILRPGLVGSVIGLALTFTVFWWWWRLVGLGQ